MDNSSLAHTKWTCKYHIVFAPKFRRKVIYKNIRADIGHILSELCKRKGIEIIAAEAMPDHVHMFVSIPPKYSVGSDGVFEGEKFAYDFRQACQFEIQIWESTLLVPRVLCRYCRKECKENRRIRQESDEGRSGI